MSSKVCGSLQTDVLSVKYAFEYGIETTGGGGGGGGGGGLYYRGSAVTFSRRISIYKSCKM